MIIRDEIRMLVEEVKKEPGLFSLVLDSMNSISQQLTQELGISFYCKVGDHLELWLKPTSSLIPTKPLLEVAIINDKYLIFYSQSDMVETTLSGLHGEIINALIEPLALQLLRCWYKFR